MLIDIAQTIIHPRYKHNRPAAVVPAESQILGCKPSTLFETTNVTTNLSNSKYEIHSFGMTYLEQAEP